jgi:hypothetical protein
MLGRFNEFADAAKSFAGSALTEFSQALDVDDADGAADETAPALEAAPAERPQTPPRGPSHEAVEAMREAHALEILRLKAVLHAVQEEGEAARASLQSKISELESEISSLRISASALQLGLERKDAEIEHGNFLLSRCVEEKSRLMLEKEETDVVDGKILRPLFVQLCALRDEPRERLQTLRLVADVLRLSDADRAEARLPVDAADDADSLARQFISFLNSDLS